jgi:hypothetical protein
VLAGIAGASGAAIAGLVVYLEAIRGTVGAGGRSFAQVERYSAEPVDLLTRDVGDLETFVLLGWLLPVLAAAGLVVLWPRDRGLLAALGLAAVVPVLFALGSNTPVYEPVWSAVPGLENTRVPGRLLPVACLALAALAAFALGRIRWRWLAAAAIVLLAVDLRVDAYSPLGADERNAVYASLRAAPPGRLVERPVYLPDRNEGSVYLYYAMQAPRERPFGYSTTAPPVADAFARRLRRESDRLLLAELGVRYVVVFEDGRPVQLRRLG